MRLFPGLFRNTLVCLALLGFLAKPLFLLAHDFRSVHATSALSPAAPSHSASPIVSKASPSDPRMRVLEREKDPSDLLGLQVAQVSSRPLRVVSFRPPAVFESFTPPSFLVLRI
ncbi:MAG TPA: hypothetical protein VMV05_12420 [bacterium]|nr:hypothetical protein [bacterium]